MDRKDLRNFNYVVRDAEDTNEPGDVSPAAESECETEENTAPAENDALSDEKLNETPENNSEDEIEEETGLSLREETEIVSENDSNNDQETTSEDDFDDDEDDDEMLSDGEDDILPDEDDEISEDDDIINEEDTIEDDEIQNDIDILKSHFDSLKHIYSEGLVYEAGFMTAGIFGKILNALCREAGLSFVKSTKSFQKLDDLYKNKWVTDNEFDLLEELKNIRNHFVHKDDILDAGNAEQKNELTSYAENFQRVINTCEEDIKWFTHKIIDISNGVKVENTYEERKEKEKKSSEKSKTESYGKNKYKDKYDDDIIDDEVHNDIIMLHSVLKKIERLYKSGQPHEAGCTIGIIVSTIVNALMREAGLHSGKTIKEKIDTLYRNHWLTDKENRYLHALRDIRNCFIYFDTTNSDNRSSQKYINHVNNFQRCIDFCYNDVRWFEKKIVSVQQGIKVRNSYGQNSNNSRNKNGYRKRSNQGNRYSNQKRDGYRNNNNRNYNNGNYGQQNSVIWYETRRTTTTTNQQPVQKKLSSVSSLILFPHLLIPAFITSAISSLAAWALTDPTAQKIEELAPKFSTNDIRINIIFAIIGTLCMLFGYELNGPILAAAYTGALAYKATGSPLCCILVSILISLICMHLPQKLRHIGYWVSFVLWVMIFSLGLAPAYIKHFLLNGQPDDRYFLMTRIVTPLIIYNVALLIGRYFIHNLFVVPFEDYMEDESLPLGSIPVFGLAAVIGFLFRDTWAKGLIFVSRDFMASKDIFWAVHILIIALVLHLIFEGLHKMKQ